MTYSGETRFPLILKNIHRYFWYAAVLVALILTYDAVLTFRDPDGDWGHMGLGTAGLRRQHRPDLALHAVLPLLPPHRRRPAAALQQAPDALQGVDLRLQAQRQARPSTPGLSLFSVAVADLYVLLLATGVFNDPRFF